MRKIRKIVLTMLKLDKQIEKAVMDVYVEQLVKNYNKAKQYNKKLLFK